MHLWEWLIWGGALAAPITVFAYLWMQGRGYDEEASPCTKAPARQAQKGHR
jgi:hypothetical protein